MPTKPAKVNSPKNVHVANVPPITIAIIITNANTKVFINYKLKVIVIGLYVVIVLIVSETIKPKIVVIVVVFTTSLLSLSR